VSIVVVGLNHRTVSLDLLERMAVPESRLSKALHDLRGRENVGEVVVLSTCHRTEVYVTAERFHGAVQDIRNFLSEYAFAPPEDFADHMYTYFDGTAAAHLFAVAAGLDSVVVGESEILGQVRDAWERARDEATTGPRLDALFRDAVVTGKRVRSETAIARGTTSVAQAAVAMAIEHLGSLAGARVLVLGAGDMGESMAVALAGAGAADVQVANRTWAKAMVLATRVGGRPVQLGDLSDALAGVDVLLTSTGAPSLIVEKHELEAVMATRADRPLLVVDVAMPRDIDPAAGTLPGVTLLDLNDLRGFAEAGLAERRREIPHVRRIVDQEVARHLEQVAARRAVPTVIALRERAEALRRAELERYRARLESLDPRERDAVEALTRGILAKLLHDPTVRLKDAAGSVRGERLADTLTELFDL
jgi:glutamyl-tRNA reductase